MQAIAKELGNLASASTSANVISIGGNKRRIMGHGLPSEEKTRKGTEREMTSK